MKMSALSLLVIVGLSSRTLAFAAECTADDLTTISTTYSDTAMSEGAAKCPDLTETKNYCDASDCLNYMTNLLDLLPDCTSGGINVRAGLEAAIDFCETGTVDPDIVEGSTSSTTLLLRSGSSSTDSSPTISSSSTGSTTSDQENEITAAPSAEGSSSASSVSVTISTAALAVTAFVVTGAL
ncbi:hypothetical protein DVH05_014996 [Phytophthora capsici]|nr:hypothetical protein DVH05_014996 [Phytophthora capsici]